MTAWRTSRTRGWRAVAAAGLLLAGLAHPVRAQVKGLSVTPHMWDWKQIADPPVGVWYSTPRFGSHREALSLEHERLARRVVAMSGPLLRSLTERTGVDLHWAGLTISDVLPADRNLQRFRYSQGGVGLFFAPDDWARLGEERWMRRQVGVQLAQALLWRALNRQRPKNPVRRYLLRRLPPAWFLLGMGAYLGDEPLPWEEQVLRASLADGQEPHPLGDLIYAETMDWVTKEEAYQQARDFCGWLARSHGVRHAVAYLDQVRRYPLRPGDTFRKHFGLGFRAARDAWIEDFRGRMATGLAGVAPPVEKRVVAPLMGWFGGLAPSPDGATVAVTVNRRYSQGRLMDLSVMPRFGDEEPRFLGGNPVVGEPCWLPGGRVAAIEETVRPFGQRVHRLVIRSLEAAPGRRFHGLPVVRELRAALRTGGDLLARTVGQQHESVIHDGELLTEVGVSPSERWLSALAWPGDRPTLRLFDLAAVLAEDRGRAAAGHATPLLERPLPGGFGHRWMLNQDRILYLRHLPEGGTQVRSLEPVTGEDALLATRPGRVRSVFGTWGRVFLVEPRPQGVDLLMELHPASGGMREVLRDPQGIHAPRAVEGMTWITYLSLLPGGPHLVEAPLPPATVAPPSLAELVLPEPESALPPAGPELPAVDQGLRLAPPGATSVAAAGLSTAPVRTYRPRYLKRNDSYVLDEDSLGVTFEWRDAFNYRSVQGAAWLGDSIHRANYQALYYNNRQRPAWFVGAFDADRQDLLGMFPLSNFNAAVAQQGALAGINVQTSPFHNWTVFAESKKLQFDLTQFRPGTPDPEPDLRQLRLQWTLNELAASPDGGNVPIGSRFLVLSLARSAFGGDAQYWELLGDWRTYHPMRRASDSFATRFLFGFRNADQDPSPVPLDFTLGGPETLRGIQGGKLAGEKFVLTTFELRRLLTNRKGMKRALSKVGLDKIMDPLRFNRIYLAGFLDMGTAYDDAFEWGRVERSVGVELRAQGLLTAFRPVSVRLGFAHGFGPLGENDVYLVTSSVF